VLAIRDKQREKVLVSLQDAEDTGLLMLFGPEKPLQVDDVVIVEDSETLDGDNAKDDADNLINASDVTYTTSLDTASVDAIVFDDTSVIGDSDTSVSVTSDDTDKASNEVTSDASNEGDGYGQDVL